LATKISFMNEIANVCEIVGADVDMVRRGIGADDRIGKRFLFAGIGYGGSCFPKDVQALVRSSEDINYDFKILNSVIKVNEIQKKLLVEKVKKYFKGDIKGKHFAMWGLAFKPETDDIREAPSLYIIDELLKAGATVSVFDPEAINNVKTLLGDKIAYCDDQYEVLKDAEALLIVTEWSAFRTPDFDQLDALLKNKVIFDGRNLYDLQKMIDCGYYYNSIGRKIVEHNG